MAAPHSNTFPNRLTELREAKGITMTDLANRLDVSRETVRRWERREYDISYPRARQIARELGVTVGMVIGCPAQNPADCCWKGDA